MKDSPPQTARLEPVLAAPRFPAKFADPARPDQARLDPARATAESARVWRIEIQRGGQRLSLALGG